MQSKQVRARKTSAIIAALTLLAGGGLAVPPAAAATAALPDMKILVPTNLISIGIDAPSGQKLLRYTHMTENAGVGPFELDPTYNPTTRLSTFVQAIYSSSSPGVWALDHTVPLARNGSYVDPDDYIFPLTKFTLNTVNADGSVGSVVATSPKTDYCMTGNVRVGDVANTPAVSAPPISNCEDPTKPLGWSVGWADEYDQVDSGQPIDISALPNGGYVLRATVDPQHLLTEVDASNNVTDTRLTISGTSVTVGAQTRPVVAPPLVSLNGPPPGSSVSGSVSLTATASATSATVTSVQYLLDGVPLGGPQASAPYAYIWTVGATPAGAHRLSAQVTDSAGNVGSAPVVGVTVASTGPPPAPFSLDQTVTRTGRGTTTTAPFSTGSAGETVVALVGSDGPATAASQRVVVSGAGLTWHRVRQANAQFGDSEVWAATAASALTGATVTSTPSATGFDQQLTVLTLRGSGGVGASTGASAATGAPSVGLTTTAAGALTYAVGNDWDRAISRTPGGGQALVNQWLDTASGDTMWVQGTTAASTAIGQTRVLNDTAPTTDRWNLVGVEVVPAGATPPPDTTPPTATITTPAPGQIVAGTVPVAATANDDIGVASVQFLLDGQPQGTALTAAPYTIQWVTTSASAGAHAVSARVTDTSGNVGTSAAVNVTVQNPAPPMTCFVLQAQKSVHGTGIVNTPAFSTAIPGERLFALVATDGPSAANGQTVTVSGAGLTWTLVKRANAQWGDSEIWTATAAGVLTNVTVRSTPARTGFDQDLTVIAMEGSAGAGVSATASAASGAAGVSLTTSAPASLVFAVGNDWDNATARTLPTGLVSLDQWVDTRTGDTMWSEYTNQATGAAGTAVNARTTAPTGDRWNMAAVEVLGEVE